MRALSARLDGSLGRDRARVVHTFPDGWTIRRVTRLADQHREGELMHNCLRRTRHRDLNCWSLRDPDNLPHLSFAAWRLTALDDVSAISGGPVWNEHFLHLRTMLFYPGKGRKTKPVHVRRLRSFAVSPAAQVVPRLPTDNQRRIEVIANAVLPDKVTKLTDDQVPRRTRVRHGAST
jgi:hypothetical protein